MSLLMKGVGEAGGFSPASIAGLALWLDADDAATFTFSSSTIVSQWNDKSGNNRHCSQGTVANQPNRNGTQNGRSTVVFDGTNDRLTSGAFAIAQPCTILAAVKYVTPGAANAQVFGQVGGGPTMWISTGAHALYAGSVVSTAVAADATFRQITDLYNGASSLFRLDGSQRGGALNPGVGSSTAASIGSSGVPNGFANIELGEILLYNSFLSATDYQAVEAYLKAKWGTP